MCTCFFLAVFITTIFPSSQLSELKNSTITINQLKQILEKTSYQKEDSPYIVNKEMTNVTIGLDLWKLNKIDTQNYAMDINFGIYVYWTDRRLYISNTSDVSKQLYNPERYLFLPDILIANAMSMTRDMIIGAKHSSIAYVHLDGRIEFNEYFRVVLSCPMNLQLYPFDIQTCPITLDLNGHQNGLRIDFYRLRTSCLEGIGKECVTSKSLRISDYTLLNISERKTVYDELEWELSFKRNVSPLICLLYTSPSPRD